MKKLIYVVMVIAIMFVSCGQNANSDENDILQLLESSLFTADGSVIPQDDESTNPGGVYSFSGIQEDSILPFPDINYVRKINRPITKYIKIEITGDSAYASFDGVTTGKIYVKNTLGGDSLIYQHDFADTFHREIVLKKVDKGWRIQAFTPLKIWTKGKDNLKIEKIVATSTSGKSYTLDDFSSFIARENVFTFPPGDTVTLDITVSGDPGWMFFHVARPRFRTRRCHIRRRMILDTETGHFTKKWLTAEDSIIRTPAVRIAGFDYICMDVLTNGTDAEYSAFGVAVPYIIKKASDGNVDDTQLED